METAKQRVRARPVQYAKLDGERRIATPDGNRIVPLSATLVHSIEDLLVKTFGPIAATSFLYEIGKEAGAHSTKDANGVHLSFNSARELRYAREKLAPLWGWDTVNIVGFVSERRLLRSRCTGSVYVRKKAAKGPVCHFGRGMAAGSLSAVSGRNWDSIETACEGKRDDYCELIIGSPLEIVRVAESPK